MKNINKFVNIVKWESELARKRNRKKSRQSFRDVDDVYLDKDQRELLKHTKCLIRSHSGLKLKWDILIMIMAIFN